MAYGMATAQIQHGYSVPSKSLLHLASGPSLYLWQRIVDLYLYLYL